MVAAQLEQLIANENEQELLAGLKAIPLAERRKLAPLVKKLSKYYGEYIQQKTNTWSSRGTPGQNQLAHLACFICMDRKEYERSDHPTWILAEEELNKVIDWYCPEWLGDFINKQAEAEFIFYRLDYDLVMQLKHRGVLNPSKRLITLTLLNYIYEHKERTYLFLPHKLEKYPETLDEHVWHFFEEDSSIHYAGRFLNVEGKNVNDTSWIEVYRRYAASGRLDRKRVMKEALLASNRNFNKVLSGWFIDLFETMTPSHDELLDMQTEMMTVLSSIHSKPVNTILGYLKKIAGDKNFNAEAFALQVQQLLSNSAKNVVSSGLMLLEKIAAKNTALVSLVCNVATGAFIHNNDDLQVRAAKLIAKYKQKLPADFGDAFIAYRDNILSRPGELLGNLIQSTEPVLPQDHDLHIAAGKQEIPSINSVDDLVYFASQAFDNNESWHFDQLPAALIQHVKQLNGDAIARLGPALQRALKMTKTPLTSIQGHLDHMLAIFFIDVCIQLARNHEQDSEVLYQLFMKFRQQDGVNIADWMAIPKSTCYLQGWKSYSKDPFFEPFKILLLHALEKFEKEEVLPLLSTPTHAPAYIHPVTLVKRLALYQQANKQVNDMDLQIAISRCDLDDTAEALHLAEQLLKSEYRSLMAFLFSAHDEPAAVDHPTAWVCASLCRKVKKQYDAFHALDWYNRSFPKYIGDISWHIGDRHYKTTRYDADKQALVEVPAVERNLMVKPAAPVIAKKGLLKKFVDKLSGNPVNAPFLYDHFIVKATYMDQQFVWDLKRAFLLVPNNPDPWLAVIFADSFRYPSFFSEMDKKITIAFLQVLHTTMRIQGKIAHTFLGACMVCSDKTAANIAGEIWLQAVPQKQIDNNELGTVIGRMVEEEFVPLKRFTDLASQLLFRISAAHNLALCNLLEQILLQLPSQPIKNLKRLLELYLELLVMNTATASQQVLQQIQQWETSASVEKIVKGIKAKVVN